MGLKLTILGGIKVGFPEKCVCDCMFKAGGIQAAEREVFTIVKIVGTTLLKRF